jgi:hypothetical protein
MARRYPRDPYWLSFVRFAVACAGCGAAIPKATRAFFYPNDRRLYGAACGCGERAARDFASALGDEVGTPVAV